MPCIACGRDFHEECYNDDGCEGCHKEEEQRVRQAVQALTFGSAPATGSRHKDDDKVTDRYSTGRKRAALDYPLYLDQPCEWRGLKNVGGGVPIFGCLNGFQQDRHHGPVKDTLRNEPGNVHRICKKCHKRWHYFNDKVYVEATWDKTEHEPEEATEDELKAFELKWLRTHRSDVKIDEED